MVSDASRLSSVSPCSRSGVFAHHFRADCNPRFRHRSQNFGLGGGLDLSTIRIKDDAKDDELISASYSFAGPRIFVVASS